MIKKVFLSSLVLSGFIFSMTGMCFADAASDLSQVESYIRSGQVSQAEQLCTSITQRNPGSDYALKAQGKLAVAYIMTQKILQSDAEVAKLMNDYKSNAELPAILYGIVLRYKTAREFQRAENLSQRICQEYPSSFQAQKIQLDSGKELAFNLIADGKYQQAEEAVDSMVAAAGSSSAMPSTLFKIAREFKESSRYDETMRIYQRIAQDYPSSEFGGKARMGVDKLKIWNLIKAGDTAGAQAGLEKLITDYKDEDDLPHTVRGVAVKFEEGGYYEQAKALYQRVINDYAGTDMAAKSLVDLKKCDVRAMVGKSSFSEVLGELTKLREAFPGHWHLPEAIGYIGEEYYRRAARLESQGSVEQAKELYRNAAVIGDIAISQVLRSSSMPDACNYAAICYEKLGEYDKANQCYQKVIDSYPGYRWRWNMMFKVGRNYEQMKKAGTISAEEADSKTKAMYEKLLAEYPNCKAATAARLWLKQ